MMKMMKFNGTSVSYPSSVSNLSNFRILLFSIKNNTLAEIREEIDHRNRSSRNSKKKKKKKIKEHFITQLLKSINRQR